MKKANKRRTLTIITLYEILKRKICMWQGEIELVRRDKRRNKKNQRKKFFLSTRKMTKSLNTFLNEKPDTHGLNFEKGREKNTILLIETAQKQQLHHTDVVE